jgi:nucleoid DNA-binding protein
MNKSDLTGKNIDVRPKKLPFFKVGKEMKGMADTKKM